MWNLKSVNSLSCQIAAIAEEQRTAPFSGVEVFNKDLLKHVETTEKKPPLPTPQGTYNFRYFRRKARWKYGLHGKNYKY